MKHVPADSYRRAFVTYLRTGAPVRLALKQTRPTTHYVWRTAGDERVRLSHAANEGRLCAWDHPPATGHPGEEFGCRCTAEPYVARETEFAFHEMVGELIDEPDRWELEDFLRHLYAGGEPVSLSQIGHLNDIVEFFGYRHTNDQGVGAFRRLSDQIVAAARDQGNGIFRVSFSRSYDFTPVALPHGGSTVFGAFVGRVDSSNDHLVIQGGIDFFFIDLFTDPLNIRETVNGTSDPIEMSPLWSRLTDGFGQYYTITGRWETRFQAEASLSAADSLYRLRD